MHLSNGQTQKLPARRLKIITTTAQATGFIDSTAVEQQARAARADAAREAFAALATQFSRLFAVLRPAPRAGNGQPRSGAYA